MGCCNANKESALIYLFTPMPSNEALEITGQYTMNDILRFQYFQSQRRIWWFAVPVTAFLFLILGVAAFVSVVYRSVEVARAAIPIVLATIFWLTLVGLCPYLSARRVYKTSIALGEPVSFEFAANGVHAVTGYSSGDTSWKAFWAIYEAKTFFSLYFNAGSAWLLPKRFFSDLNQQEQWCRLVEAQIEPKKIVKPGVVGKLL